MVTLFPPYSRATVRLKAKTDRSCEAKPTAADLNFLLGYHYLTAYHLSDALKKFQRALALQPNDTVTAALVATLTETAPASSASSAPKAVSPDAVLGTWSATGRNSAAYTLALAKDGTFTWSFQRGTRKQEAKGVYTLEGNILAMEPDSGGVLLAELSFPEPGTAKFKMITGAKGDPGLEFRLDAPK